MGCRKFLKAAALAVLAAALLLPSVSLAARGEPRVLVGILLEADARSGSISLSVKTPRGAKRMNLILDKGSKVLFRGRSAEMSMLQPGSELMVTYIERGGRLHCTAVRRVK